jgi:uncharacterized protein YgiM (DUF1202 family)
MKMNYWLTLGVMMVTSAVAQDNTNAVPQMPAPTAPSPAEVAPATTAVEINAPPANAKPAKHKKHKAAAPEKIAFTEPTAALIAGPAEVAVNVNVRGQAGLKGDVVAHLVKGDAVTVLSQINLNKHKAGEPAQWAEIVLPTSAHVWVRTLFIDETNKTVLPKKLNLRAGPSENYNVLGVIERGTQVSEVKTKDDWMEIDAPTNTHAFVAAMYLKQATPAAPETPAVETPPIVAEPMAPLVEQTPPPPQPRIVTHEGVVRHVGSIVAPTKYELFDPKTGQNIDYLYTTSPSLDLSRYVNMRIIVTGEEGLDVRWKDTPLINIQSIQVISTNAVPSVIYNSPRQS